MPSQDGTLPEDDEPMMQGEILSESSCEEETEEEVEEEEKVDIDDMLITKEEKERLKEELERRKNQ